MFRRPKKKPSALPMLLWVLGILLLGAVALLLAQSSCHRKAERAIPATGQPEAPQPPGAYSPPAPPQGDGGLSAGPGAKAPAERPAPPRIALVIDDLGQSEAALVSRLCSLGIPLTVAVLPFLPQTQENARLANSKGAEVILHMPMEPLGYPGPSKNPGEGAILFDQPEPEVRARMAKAMENIPHANGINNHMGSRITPERDRMTWILEEVKKLGWYFLDSRTEKDTVALEVAKELGIPAMERQVFLDDSPDPAEMARQWERAMSLAKQGGQAVIIGHIHPGTVAFLERALPAAKNEATFVKASALAR